MSHWTVAKVSIKNPNPELLKQALSIIASELKSRIVENFEVVGWNMRQLCQYAIPLSLPYGNGYGVYINKNGELVVVVDEHGAPMTAKEFARKLAQYYTALAVQVAAQSLGFTVSNINITSNGSIVIDLARW